MSSLIGYALAYAASLLFAVSDVLVRKASRDISPAGILFLSLTSGIPSLAVVSILLGEPTLPGMWYLLLYCAIGAGHFYFGRLFFYTAVAGLGASSAAIIVSATPIMSSFLAVLLLGEDLRPPVLAALILVTLAAYIAARNPSGRPLQNVSRSRAVLAAAAATLIFASTTVAVRWIGFHADSPVLGVVASYTGAYPLALATVEARRVSWGKPALYTALAAGVVVAFAQASRYSSLELIPVPEASVLFGLFPVNTAVISAVAGGEDERPSKKHVVAALMSVAAVAIMFS
ncbi:conserved hypothetical protein [Aeropyrum pernix K1]|uniref:EamA domain-containing protein n=1 Tax=Aeropyrum pernix (strain ATCC 700893 / DSM 11879 / JCM 9820 / NBRC 100138 / K1) TaxID=272557 RepID=Q9YDE8_AERPE|nr:DMT family transporter [Aeropyrum pernix]BAA79949.2 conserved hypothetical protein [Aeropyrum pernix K1]